MRRNHLIAAALAPAILVAGCGKKKAPKTEIVGWHTEEEWKGECYYPPNWEEMGPGDRKLARTRAMNEMIKQWRGKHDDVVKFDDEHVMDFETVLLGQPEFIEEVVAENVAFCRKVMTGMEGTERWSAWIKTRPAELTEGQCRYAPLDYTLYDYLDIGSEWQIPANVCAGNKVRVTASAQDYYRITEGGEWMNAEGLQGEPAIGDEYPCNYEGCAPGMVILRFTGDSGVQTIHPIGTSEVFTAPEHGTIEVQINDSTWYDNKFKIEGTIEHHTGITYEPAK